MSLNSKLRRLGSYNHITEECPCLAIISIKTEQREYFDTEAISSRTPIFIAKSITLEHAMVF